MLISQAYFQVEKMTFTGFFGFCKNYFLKDRKIPLSFKNGSTLKQSA